jgi:dihydropteroate synthase
MQPYKPISPRKKTLNCRGRLIDLRGGKVMGILNVTPDSFYDGGAVDTPDALLKQAEKMLKHGATFLDIGGQTTKPGAKKISPEEELSRVMPALELILKNFPEAIVSVDTFNSMAAEECLKAGAHIINDITGGKADSDMFSTVAKWNAPYIMMHIQGTPETMQVEPYYEDIAKELLKYFSAGLMQLKALGLHDVIIDPGFGFGKNLEHNYELLRKLHLFSMLEQPVMVGVSRKSMINKILNTKPESALNGTTVIHTLALLQGCDILRVHDVKEAIQTMKLVKYYSEL